MENVGVWYSFYYDLVIFDFYVIFQQDIQWEGCFVVLVFEWLKIGFVFLIVEVEQIFVWVLVCIGCLVGNLQYVLQWDGFEGKYLNIIVFLVVFYVCGEDGEFFCYIVFDVFEGVEEFVESFV